MTTPVLIIIFRLHAATAVGTALSFAAIVNCLVAPMYMLRRQVSFLTWGWMALGGLPGVVLGGLFLNRISHSLNQNVLYLVLGITIVIAALLNIFRLVRLGGQSGTGHRPRLLPFLMFPVGAEVGFSSAGSGALGSLSLLGLTQLPAAKVVGTDLLFALSLTIVGSVIQILSGNFDGPVLMKLVTGGIFGAFFGSWLALRIPSRPLKWGLAIWLTGLGLNLITRGWPALVH